MTEPRRPALLGLTAYLLIGLALGVTHLLAHAVLGLNPVHDRLDSPLTDAIRDVSALPLVLFALLVFLPVLAAGTAALMGRHGGRTLQPSVGAAAVTTLIGIPLVWVCLAIAALLVGLALRAQGLSNAFGDTVDALVASIIQLLLVLGPLVGLAAITAHRAQRWAQETERAVSDHIDVEESRGGPYGGELATDPSAWMDTGETEGVYPEGLPEDQTPMEEPRPEDPNVLHDHPVDCPRCGRRFTVSGHRPLRITCPDCGKTGTIS